MLFPLPAEAYHTSSQDFFNKDVKWKTNKRFPFGAQDFLIKQIKKQEKINEHLNEILGDTTCHDNFYHSCCNRLSAIKSKPVMASLFTNC
jgi:hypothetical protein